VKRCLFSGECGCADAIASASAGAGNRGTISYAPVCLSPSSKDGIDWLIGRLGLPADLSSVALKLNLCDYRAAASGATTSPHIVGLIIEALRLHAPNLERIVLVEGDSSGTRARDLYALLGFESLAGELGCELFYPETGEWRACGRVGSLPIELPGVLWDVDLLINVPKIKLHGRTAITGALKNNFGLLRQRWKVPYHQLLCSAIALSNTPIQSQLVIADGSVLLSGRGPAFGTPLVPNLMLGSWNPVALDSAMASLLGVPATFLGHVRLAETCGLGSSQYLLQAPDDFALPRLPRLDWLRFYAANLVHRA